MPDWSTIQTDLPAVVTSALATWTGAVSVHWKGLPQAWRELAQVKLSLRGMQNRGRDETRQTEVGDQVQQRQYGVRRLVLQIECETQDQNLAASAVAMAELLRTRIQGEDLIALLQDMDLAVASVRPFVHVEMHDEQERARSYAAFEIFLTTSTSVDSLLVDYVAAVSGTYTVTGGDEDPRSGTFTAGTPDPP